MRRGFLFLVAVMDWHSRKILSWRLSNTMHADSCIEALQEAITRYGKPDIVNTDQGSQFTCTEFIELLKTNAIAISMDGKGCWRDNVLIERFWRTIKYQEVYLKVYESTSDARANIRRFIDLCNSVPGHGSLQGQPPDSIYFGNTLATIAAWNRKAVTLLTLRKNCPNEWGHFLPHFEKFRNPQFFAAVCF
jgi:putative transposase